MHRITYPENIKTLKSKISYWCFWQWYIINVGKGNVIGRFTSLIPEFGWIIAFLELYTPIHFNWFSILMTILCAYAISWIIGWFWITFNLDKIEGQVSQERNVLLDEIHKEIVKNRSKL